MSSVNMNNPIVILDNITLDLTDDIIAEMTMGMGQVNGLVCQTNPETSAPTAAAAASPSTISAATTPAAATPAAAPATDDDWFRAGPSRTPASRATPRPSPGRKNMELLESFRMPPPSPTPSTSTQSSVADEEDYGDFAKFLVEEQRRRSEEEARRVEWRRLCAGRRAEVEKKWGRARENISSLTGEGKRLKNQREALRAQVRALEAQLRALDDEETDLEKRKRSALKSERKYGLIVAKYREMDL